MSRPLGATDVLKYVNAGSPARRTRVVRDIVERTGAYEPALDFWMPIRSAIRSDRATTRDGARVRGAAARANPRRRPSYERVALAWDRVHPRWRAARHESTTPADARLVDLLVEVRPTFAERRPDGILEVVGTWLLADELTPVAFDLGLRMIERAFPGAVAVVCDLQRERVASSEGWDLSGVDDLLVDAATALSDEVG
ncbi:hypothetical protein [Cellulomonas sp. PSBB021]|uniref:hypothetical protein n=1 Tax=Cellulomonas sp. PSBB021 TaxID=2003551 RepID=UPI000B8D7333|nr:hypothetical protein [Cellulomonas sp. PSBB021]ASR55585.1 hypothetical protein CBP52_11340 [Cellulomonas sp. PSBB021]